MPINILMPALSPTMEEGKLAKWMVQEGQAVKAGDVIAEIETDKATMEVEAVDEGIIGRIMVPEGTEGVKVNKLIAVLLEDGEDASAIDINESPAVRAGVSLPPAPEARLRHDVGRAGEGGTTTLAGSRELKTAAAVGSPPPRAGGASSTRPSPTRGEKALASSPRTNGQTARVFASPLARRLARDGNIDLAGLSGSGPRGRIVKSDVEAVLKGGTARAVAPAMTPGAAATAGAVATGSAPMLKPITDDKVLAIYEPGSYEVVPHDGMRRIIAERLTLSKRTIPHFYLGVDCRLDQLLSARKRLNERAPKDGPRAFKLSVNDFVIKALALALQQVPGANATWTDAGTLRHKRSDVGVAVAVDGGLFTPVIRHADLKTLSEISNEMKDLAARARGKRLAPHEYQGGTTSISNLGMYGIKSFDAVINPPHASILAVGAGEERAVVTDGKLEVATIMSVTLSCDHRVVDGALAAELLGAFKGFIEDPVRMLV